MTSFTGRTTQMIEPLERRIFQDGTAPAAQLALAAPMAIDTPRASVDLDAGWKFDKGDSSHAERTSFDDSDWRDVTLPHTWNASDGANGGSNYYRGVGWYRKQFTAPQLMDSQRVILKFEGASLVADVYVNGQRIGRHEGGFATFTFDITDHLTAGANLLAVKVSNADNRSVAPIEGEGVTLGGPDFTIFGGLYRDVSLVITAPLHVSLDDYGSDGVYLDQSKVSAASAEVQIRTRVQNDTDSTRAVTVVAQVIDALGNVVAQTSKDDTIPAGKTVEVTQSTTVINPHLWNGVADPYLYTVVVKVMDGQTLTDTVVQPLGLRFYKIDPKKGFFLNGQYLNLHGVDYHQDEQGEGWAKTDADTDRDVALMLEMGVNYVRLAHYQHSPHTYEALDRAGIIAWTEIPYIYDETESSDFTDNLKRQLREEIRQTYNNPSVIFRGLFNGLNDDEGANNLVPQLQKIVEKEDPTRITTAAGVTRAGLEADVNTYTDVIAYNDYFGWYRGDFSDLGPYLDDYHRNNPNRGLGISEYGAGGSPTQHEENPNNVVATDGKFHPEEYQALFHESHWKQLKSRPWVWGKLVFGMFDFASDGRSEGDAHGVNDKGLVTYDRQTKKDAFYFYKANWTDTPFVYITSRRFTEAPDSNLDVKVYSTLDSLTLTVNGNTIASKGGDSVNVFRWGDVKLKAGLNTVTVTGTRDGKTYSDTVVWSAPGSSNGASGKNGLKATYYDNADFTGASVNRIDPTIDFDWGTASPDVLIGGDTFSAVWTGRVMPQHSETYTFYTQANNGVRLWVNGQLIIDKWSAGGTLEYSGTIALEAGKKYAIRMEYFENVANASANLFWRSPSLDREIIPASRLFNS